MTSKPGEQASSSDVLTFALAAMAARGVEVARAVERQGLARAAAQADAPENRRSPVPAGTTTATSTATKSTDLTATKSTDPEEDA